MVGTNAKGQSFDYAYNCAIYHFTRCQFQQAYDAMVEAKKQPVPEEHEDRVRYLELLVSTYRTKSADYKTWDEKESLHPLLRILDQLSNIKLSKLTYGGVLELQKQCDELAQRIKLHGGDIGDPYEAAQVGCIADGLRTLGKAGGRRPARFENTNQYVSRFLHVCSASRGAFPTAQAAKTFKPAPDRFPDNQRLGFEALSGRPQPRVRCSAEVQLFAQGLLLALGNYAQLPLHGFPDRRLMYLQKNARSAVEVAPSAEETPARQIVCEMAAKPRPERKPMPQRWVKKPKQRFIKQQHHQGAVADKAEVSKVSAPAAYRGGRPGGNHRPGGRGGRGRR